MKHRNRDCDVVFDETDLSDSTKDARRRNEEDEKCLSRADLHVGVVSRFASGGESSLELPQGLST